MEPFGGRETKLTSDLGAIDSASVDVYERQRIEARRLACRTRHLVRSLARCVGKRRGAPARRARPGRARQRGFADSDGDLGGSVLAFLGGGRRAAREPRELETIERALDSEELHRSVQALDARQVTLAMPRFRFASSFRLQHVLAKMGVSTAFGPHADFSRISSEPGFAVSELLH